MEPRGHNKIIVVLGPTSSGKSEVAIKLAKKFNGEIISADSRQVYRGLDVGSGKVTKAEQRLAKHWLLDIVGPKTDYNAAKFKKDADKIIADILRRDKLPIICGGTGFWIKAVVDNVAFPDVAPDKVLRNKLRSKTAAQLFAMLKKLDSIRAKNIDRHNPVRLIRAIEIAKTLGKVPALATSHKLQTTNCPFLQIGIDVPKDKLQRNIRKRLEKRFAQGIIKEVKDLHEKKKLSWKKIQRFGLGYFLIPLYLQDKISKADLFEKIYQAEKDYAKRQMTWFRRDVSISWLKKYEKIEKMTKTFLLK